MLSAASTPTRAAVAAVAVAVGVVAGLVTTAEDEQPTRPIVLVSGRDDHGALVAETVPLLAAPAAEGAGDEVGRVPDGTLVAVLGDDGGSWLEVATLDGGSTGWVDDYHLRGTAHVVGDPPACPTPLHAAADGPVLGELRASEQVEVVDHHRVGGRDWAGVRTVQGRALGLVPMAWLQQLPGPAPVDDVDCATITPDPDAVPHEH